VNMLTTEQIGNWFTYHAPTEETAPKYAEIRAAEIGMADVLATLHANVNDRFGVGTMEKVSLAFYGRVNLEASGMVRVIDANAPDCADKTAAIRCVRLVRNAANEVTAALVACQERGDLYSLDWFEAVLTIARAELFKARWQACSAIACGGR